MSKIKVPKKTKLVPIPKLLRKAEIVFNCYIRRRDEDEPCISCGQHRAFYDAGHFVPVKNSSFLRYHEWNVNKECKGCNCFDEFHHVRYRKNLINKIGLDAVEWLEANERTVKKWTREELFEIIKKYSDGI